MEKTSTSNVSTDGDDSITEVAQSPKKFLEIDLTNSPQILKKVTEIDLTHSPRISKRVTEIDLSGPPQISKRVTEIDLSGSPQIPRKVAEIDLTHSPQPVVTTKLIPRTRPTPTPPLGPTEVSVEECDSDEEEGPAKKKPALMTPAKQAGSYSGFTSDVDIDLTASPVTASSANHSGLVGSDQGCSVCLDSLRDIRKSRVKEQVMTSCGHLFCSNCTRTQFSVRPFCPVCQKEDPKIWIYVYNRRD